MIMCCSKLKSMYYLGSILITILDKTYYYFKINLAIFTLVLAILIGTLSTSIPVLIEARFHIDSP